MNILNLVASFNCKRRALDEIIQIRLSRSRTICLAIDLDSDAKAEVKHILCNLLSSTACNR